MSCEDGRMSQAGAPANAPEVRRGGSRVGGQEPSAREGDARGLGERPWRPGFTRKLSGKTGGFAGGVTWSAFCEIVAAGRLATGLRGSAWQQALSGHSCYGPVVGGARRASVSLCENRGWLCPRQPVAAGSPEAAGRAATGL